MADGGRSLTGGSWVNKTNGRSCLSLHRLHRSALVSTLLLRQITTAPAHKCRGGLGKSQGKINQAIKSIGKSRLHLDFLRTKFYFTTKIQDLSRFNAVMMWFWVLGLTQSLTSGTLCYGLINFGGLSYQRGCQLLFGRFFPPRGYTMVFCIR